VLISTCDFTAALDIKPALTPPVAATPPALPRSPRQHLGPLQVSPNVGVSFSGAVPSGALSPLSPPPGHYSGNNFAAAAYPAAMQAARRSSAISYAPHRSSEVASPLKRPLSGDANNGFAGGEESPAAAVSPVLARPVYLVLGEEEMLCLMKLEMSFENSNSSLPCMSPETAAIWNAVLTSYNFELLKNGFHFDWISEAIEVSLRRNLIFMQVPYGMRKNLFLKCWDL
jgi:hypothetical protein